MQLDAERLEFAAAIEDFCRRECGTLAQRDALTQNETLANSPEILDKMASLGWLGVSLPEEYGGGGAGFVTECVFLEETTRGLAPVLAYSTGLTAAQTYLKWGDEDQKKTIVGNLAAGKIEAIALSEPGTGSDLGAVRTRAVRDGDGYVIDGQKTWISAAHVAEHMLVLVREDATAYMRQREAFGAPISTFQALRHRVADLATDIEVTRAFVYDVAQAIDEGREDNLARESAMAKMRATEVAKNTALEAMQLMGGAGFAREFGMEYQVRRALAPPIFGGTNEIQREIIAKTLL